MSTLKLPSLDETQPLLPFKELPLQTKGELENRRNLSNRLLEKSLHRIDDILDQRMRV